MFSIINASYSFVCGHFGMNLHNPFILLFRSSVGMSSFLERNMAFDWFLSGSFPCWSIIPWGRRHYDENFVVVKSLIRELTNLL
jgi:hypothetical protein